MSGCGRRHRAKHLTQQYLDATAWQGPAPGECLAVCLGTPQGQHVRVLIVSPPHSIRAVTCADDAAAAVAGNTGAAPVPTRAHQPTARSDDTASEGVSVHTSCTPVTAVTAAPVATTATDDDRELDKSTRCATATTATAHPDEPREVLAWLPGKFRKVIWLSVKDVVVLAQGTVQCKPSPAQLQNFLRDPAHAMWAQRIRRAQDDAELRRRAVERLPTHIHMASTTTSSLPAPVTVSHCAVDASRQDARVDGDDDDNKDEDDVAAMGMVNRNRNNIRHQQQYFCFAADEESECSADDDERVGTDNVL